MSITELEQAIKKVDEAILAIVEGKTASYSVSGGGGSRSRNFLSLSELQAYRKELEAELRNKRPRRSIVAGFRPASPYKRYL